MSTTQMVKDAFILQNILPQNELKKIQKIALDLYINQPNYEIGFGIDLYFEYFKFSPSIRGVFGMKDELIRDNDPNSPWT